jgi:hypothetical protein
MGPKQSTGARLQLADNYGDIIKPEFILSNRAFKAALIRGSGLLTVQNPYDIDGDGTTIAGYIDMVGAANTYPNTDMIKGYEYKPTRCSASEAVRRKDLTDTDDNSEDFIAARYASDGLTTAQVELKKPRNATAGKWDPFYEPPPPAGSEKLMILQANTYGNDNGGGGGFPRSLVELYNNTGAAINLSTGNYYLHIGTNSA